MLFTIRNTFHTSPENYWNRIFFDPSYNSRLYEALGFTSFELLELTGDPGGPRTRTMRTEPAAEAPAVVRKLIGDSLTYTESGSFDPSDAIWRYEIQTNKLSEKVSITGKLWVEPVADGIERVAECDVSVKVFGVGGAIERFIEKTTRDSYVKTTEFTNAFIKEKGLSLGQMEKTS